MGHFCENPNCELYNIDDRKDRLALGLKHSYNQKEYTRCEFSFLVDGEVQSLYFCDVCISALETIENFKKRIISN